MTDGDLGRVESLCAALFGVNSAERARAQQELDPLCRIDAVGQLCVVMERSGDQFAQYFVAATLSRLVTDSWSSLSGDQQLDLQRWLLQTIWTKGPSMQRHTTTALVLVLCRLTKLGWLETPKHQELPSSLVAEAGSNRAATTVAFSLLAHLVAEVNTLSPKTCVTLHRKISVSFRDVCLGDLFKAALSVLQEARAGGSSGGGPAPDAAAVDAALRLALECLSFDFIGVLPDESLDEAGGAQVPTSWRPVILDQQAMPLLWDLYAALPPPQSTKCLCCLIQLATLRRSFFTSDDERKGWLQLLLTGTLTVLQRQQGLTDPDNYYEFCRLLSRIKPHYQLSELVSVDAYTQWVESCAQFTITSFVNWRVTSKAHYSLLIFWSRLVSSQHHLKSGDRPSLFQELVPRITEAYVISRMQMAEAFLLDPNCLDDSSDHQDALLGHLEAFPVVARSFYGATGPRLLQLLGSVVAELQAGAHLSHVNPDAARKLAILESQLTWGVHLLGALVGSHPANTSNPEGEKVDGEITAFLFKLCPTVEARASMPGAERSETLQGLEKAMLYFLQCFRRVHIGESSMPCSKIYPALQEIIGVKDHLEVLDFVIKKLVSNLKVWRTCPAILGDTLTLFCDLSTGYSSARILLKLSSIKYMLDHHSGPDFPFLLEQFNTRHRSRYYKALTNLLFMDSLTESSFDRFVHPMEEVFQGLEGLPNADAFLDAGVKRAVLGLLRDLRGLLSGCANKRQYTLAFDWLFPRHMPLLQRLAQAYATDTAVSIPLLKFFAEIVHNRGQRIVFEPNSSSGILLFKTAAELLVLHGRARLALPVPAGASAKELYTYNYKGYTVCMTVLHRCLAGGYCNIGAMQYYKDDTVDRTLATVLQIALSIPLDDIIALEKLGTAYYALLELLCTSHCPTLAALDTQSFLRLMHSLERAIPAVQLSRAAVASAVSAVGALVGFYHLQRRKQTPVAAALHAHLFADPSLLARLLGAIFNAVLFDDNTATHWAMGRAMLPLILAGPAFYEEYQRGIIGSAPSERQGKLREAFGKLMEGVDAALEAQSRDKFTANVTTFRHSLKAIP